MLPNLFVPGAGKAGTSSLHVYLDSHPDISMSIQKEPHILSAVDYTTESLTGYAPLFGPNADGAVYRGESSTGYFLFPHVPERMASVAPDARLVFMLRNPVDRAMSHYRWLVSLGEVRAGFRATFERDMHETPDPRQTTTGNYGYIYQEGRYGSNLSRFLDHFERRQIHLVETNQLRTDPASTLAACWRFLELQTPPGTAAQVLENQTRSVARPRLRSWVGRRVAAPGRVTVGTRTLVSRVLGAERTHAVRDAAYHLAGGREVEVLVDVDRQWLARHYATDVARLREQFPAFNAYWAQDFPI